jgi:hypothetical protein
MFGENNNCDENITTPVCQTHTHEFLGSVMLPENQPVEPHNHRFAGVTSEVIPFGDSHVHAFLTNTDFYENHHHEVGMVTGPAIPVGDRHVHFAQGTTTMDNGHFHDYRFATLILDPIGE